MKRFFKILVVSTLCILGAASAGAQGVLNVRVNEVLVINESNILDDYGTHQSWIEVFNTGFERVNIGGCFIGIRYANRYDADGNKQIKKYYIPKGDPNTQMSTHEYRVFFCEGNDTKGTYYTNFKLDDDTIDMVILYNSNGKDIISVFKFPDNYVPVADVSLGLIGHDEPESYIFPSFTRKENKELKGDAYLDELAARLKYHPQVMPKTTPNATNEVAVEVPKHELFRRSDPSGIVMTLTAMGVVFSALVLIFLVLKLFGKIMVSRTNKKEAVHSGVPVAETKSRTTNYTAEEVAAIGMALKMFQEDLHIKEATVITINRVGRMYSPWSSKIHGIRQVPDKKLK